MQIEEGVKRVAQLPPYPVTQKDIAVRARVSRNTGGERRAAQFSSMSETIIYLNRGSVSSHAPAAAPDASATLNRLPPGQPVKRVGATPLMGRGAPATPAHPASDTP
ncbi:unnamed protein product [Arctogadus glacialis]